MRKWGVITRELGSFESYLTIIHLKRYYWKLIKQESERKVDEESGEKEEKKHLEIRSQQENKYSID